MTKNYQKLKTIPRLFLALERKAWIRQQSGWAKQVEGKKAPYGEGSERGQSCGPAISWQVYQVREESATGLAAKDRTIVMK